MLPPARRLFSAIIPTWTRYKDGVNPTETHKNHESIRPGVVVVKAYMHG